MFAVGNTADLDIESSRGKERLLLMNLAQKRRADVSNPDKNNSEVLRLFEERLVHNI